MMGKKVKVLMVGAAFSADLHMDGYARCRDIAEIVAICDKDVSRINSLAARYDLKDFVPYDNYEAAIAEANCDLVDICMPNYLHHEVAMLAFKKGRHVIAEKPLATSVEDAIAMITAAEKAAKKLYYAEDWLFAPAINKVIEIIDEGAIGKPLYIRARECHGGSHSPYAQTIRYCGGGSVIHLGIHPIGLIMAMKKGRWTELVAMTSGGLNSNFLHKKMEGEDWAACMVKFDDNTSALIESNYITVGGMEDVVDIYGTAGCMHVDLTFSSAVSCFSMPGLKYTVEKAEITTGWSKPAVDEKYNLGYFAEIRHFMESCLENKDARTGVRGVDGLEALKIVSMIYKSAKEGIKISNDNLN